MKSYKQFLVIVAALAIAGTSTFSRFVSAQRSSKNMVVSRTADGADTDTFTPKDHVIYCIATVPNGDPKATYKFVWGQYGSISTPKTLFQEEVTARNGHVVSKFSSSADLPAGEYVVNLWTPSGHGRKVFAVKE